MAQRGFGLQTLTGGAQPVFGTLTTAPITPSPDLQTNALNAASAPSQSSVAVSSAAIFRQGDHVLIGPAADFNVQSVAHAPDGGTVSAVSYSANTITVNGLRRAHNASEWAILSLPCAQVNIQNTSNAQTNLGEDPTISAGTGSAYLLAELAASGSTGSLWSSGFGAFGNMVETQRLWVQGTANQTFLPSLLTI